MASTSSVEISKVARVKGIIKKPWIAIKSKFKNTRQVKKPIQVIPSPQKQVEIDPSLKGPVEVSPSPHEAAPSVDLPDCEDIHTHTHPVHIEPPRISLSSLPGLQTLKRATLDEAHPTSLPDHPETTPQRQGSDLYDSVRSDMAIFGDTQNSSNDRMKVVPNQLQNPPVEVPRAQKAPTPAATVQKTLVQPTTPRNPQIRVVPFQATPTQNTPPQAQHPLVNQIDDNVEVAKLAIPGFTTPRPQGALAQFPGLFSPPLTPNSPQPKLPQQKTPLRPANLFLSPSPIMVVPDLGTPSSLMLATPTTPTTPIMPPTPIKHQGRIPVGYTPNQTPVLPPRSPRRPPPHGLDPISTVDGEKKDFGTIGDRRVRELSAGLNGVVENQPQPEVIGIITDKPESEGRVPSVKVEHTSGCNEAEGQGDRDGTKPRPSQTQSKGIRTVYVGEMKYFIGRYLGGGGMGKVYSVVSKESMALAALKVIRRKDLDSEDLAIVKGEWAVLKAISEAKFFHARRPDGIQFLHHLSESWYDRENVYFVMPLCVYSLWGHLDTVKFDPLTIRVYAAELIAGLEALHRMRIIHCDLKPDNILVFPDGHLSISDFGLTVSWLDQRYKGYPSHAFRGRRLGGTEGYMAPEIVSAFRSPDESGWGNFGFSADIWSLGVVIAELGMCGRRFVAYEDDEERERWENNFRHFSQTMGLSREMLMKRVNTCLRGDHAMLVERMIEISEPSRATFDEIASHPFFSDLDLAKVSRREYQVPIPPFHTVLPCWHTNADKDWFARHSQVNEGESTPEGGFELDEMQAVGLTSDIDRWLMPDDLVWELNKAAQLAARKARQAATHA